MKSFELQALLQPCLVRASWFEISEPFCNTPMVSIGLGGNHGGTKTIVISHWVLGWAIKCRLDHVDPEWASQEGPSLLVFQKQSRGGATIFVPGAAATIWLPRGAIKV